MSNRGEHKEHGGAHRCSTLKKIAAAVILFFIFFKFLKYDEKRKKVSLKSGGT